MTVVNLTWQQAFNNKKYITYFILGIALLVATLAGLPFFFNYLQQRQGVILNDWLLNLLPAHNLSVPIFSLVWLFGLLIIIQSIKYPSLFLGTLYSFLILTWLRYITLSTVALNPPPHLVSLTDPIVSIFYGQNEITKDLFFSGHTATQFILFLNFKNKYIKTFALISTIAIGIMVLIQHVHYSIDVLFAFPFGYLAYYLSKKIIGKVA